VHPSDRPPPSDEHTPDWLLLERVASGQASTADRAALAHWIGTDPERQRLFESVERVVHGVRAAHDPTFDAAASLARVRTRLGMTGTPGDTRDPHLRVSPRHGIHLLAERSPAARFGMLAAASVVLAVGAVVGLTVVRHRGASTVDHLYTTATGERAELRLTDGTRVVLAPASRLHVTGGFGNDRRAVDLEGEAFFSVVHDAARPFVVHVRNLQATDVGTSFDVTAYRGDSAVRVSVAEGRVALTAGSAAAVPLAGGDVASVGATGVPTVNHHVDITAFTNWTSGRLDFRAIPLRDAVRELSRWYAVDLTIGDRALDDVPLTASFRDEPVTEVLHILAVTVGARVVRHDNTLVLLPRGAPPQAP
jgi:transmembrane sensor